MLERRATYRETLDAFAWRIPERFNIGTACSDAHADGTSKPALIFEEDGGKVATLSFDDLARASNRFANLLAHHGVGPGERIGILLPQSPQTAITHLGAYKLGAIALPLFILFGPEALEHRLGHSGASVLVTDAENIGKVEAIRDALPNLRKIFVVGGAGHLDFEAEMAKASDRFTAADTRADDPAVIIYTSGTTGKPKGALHAHRVLLGHLPGVQLPQEFFPQPGDVFWTPADWAWIGGLLDVLLPSLYHGVAVVAHRMAKFDPEEAFRLLAEHEVRNTFLPPTALRMMRQVGDPARFGHRVRSIGSGGETLGAEMLDWGRTAFGININEFYGQTECNLVIANCAGLMPTRPGLMGRAVPGHEVAILDAEGVPRSPGAPGMIAVRRPDPVMFLGYWNNPEATAAKFSGDWLLTGDTGVQEEDGSFRFIGRADDVITSSGYRIGPGEIEDCLLRHPSVAMAAVIGLPDAIRTEAVTAVVVPRTGIEPGPILAGEIQDFVRERLAAHLYPRRVIFAESLPLTATGKVMRGTLRQTLGSGLDTPNS